MLLQFDFEMVSKIFRLNTISVLFEDINEDATTSEKSKLNLKLQHFNASTEFEIIDLNAESAHNSFKTQQVSQEQFTIGTGSALGVKFKVAPTNNVPVQQNHIINISANGLIAKRKGNVTVLNVPITIAPSFWQKNPSGPYERSYTWYGRVEHKGMTGAYGQYGPQLAESGSYYDAIMFPPDLSKQNIQEDGTVYVFHNHQSEASEDRIVKRINERYPDHIPKVLTSQSEKHILERHTLTYLSPEQYASWKNSAVKFNAVMDRAYTLYKQGVFWKSRNALKSATETLYNDIYRPGNKTSDAQKLSKGSVFYKNTAQEVLAMAKDVSNLSRAKDKIINAHNRTTLIDGVRGGDAVTARVSVENAEIISIYPTNDINAYSGNNLVDFYLQSSANQINFIKFSQSYLKHDTVPEFNALELNFLKNYRVNPALPELAKYVNNR